ncbi:unnamed protein product [Alternaria alternata]
MRTRHPRIPNVNLTKPSLQLTPTRSLVQVAASEARRSPVATLKTPSLFFTPTTFRLGRRSTPTVSNIRDRLLANMPETSVQRVDPQKLGRFKLQKSEDLIDEWDIQYDDAEGDADAGTLKQAAHELMSTNTPVAFPTETLRALLLGKLDFVGDGKDAAKDPIPEIYRPVIERFWPGPLTIILPAPENWILAPEVTAGLTTFGARMPRSIIALSLLRL